MDLKNVSVVIPVLNEEKYIENCLDSLLSQQYPREHLEILLVDGNSDDNTVSIIKNYTDRYSFIKLYSNPNKTVQYALNIGIKKAMGEYIVRMDAHAWYAPDYISKCVEYLQKTGASNVGGPTVVRGNSPTQKIIAAAYHSPFALGGSRHYEEEFEGYADTVAWGFFRKQTLVDIGMYDERLPRSEDDDLNFRITQSGGKIFITPEIKSIYYPKDSFKKLFKQYFDYGMWKVAVIKKHKKPLRIAHLIPMCFVAFLILFGILSVFFGIFRGIFFLGILSYLLADFYFSFKSKYVVNFVDEIKLMWTHFVIHVSYGMGFWVGIFKFLNTKW